MSPSEMIAVVNMISENPTIGALVKGTGGARKFRMARGGGGKSGGYRIVTYYCADDVPVFLLDVYAKNERANLSQAERNELKQMLAGLANEWREGVRRKVIEFKRTKR